MNIVDPILFQCRYREPNAAICTPGKGFNVITYAGLEQILYNVGGRAIAAGLSPGNTVAILVQDHILHAAIILGLARLGIATLSSHSAEFPKGIRVDAIMADKQFILPGSLAKTIVVDSSWMMGEGRRLADTQSYQVRPDDICRIVLASGTTGSPKAVALSYRTIIERIMRHVYLWGNQLPYCSRVYCDLGLATELGFQFLISVLWNGGTVFFPGESFEGTVQSFNLYRVQAMVTSPAALTQYAKFYELNSAFQPGFAVVIAAGSLPPKTLSDRARAQLCANLISTYGSAEMSVVAAAPVHAIEEIPGAVGYIAPGISIEIVDQAGKVLPPEQEGLLRMRSSCGVSCYVGDASEPTGVFRDGWFCPGDIGSVTRDNVLTISDRATRSTNAQSA